MGLESWIEIAISILALLLMATAATVEATSSRRTRHRLRRLFEVSPDALEAVEPLVRERRVETAAMSLLQVVGIIVAAVALAGIFDAETTINPIIAPLVIVAICYLVFGIIVPQALATAELPFVERWAERVAPALKRSTWPVLAPVGWLTRKLSHIFPQDHLESVEGNGRDESGQPEADLPIEDEATDEVRMISGVRHLEETPVRDIMVPRVDIVAVERATPPPEVIDVIVRAGHSRIPVYDESIDHILGILYAKDLLPFVFEKPAELSLDKLVRPAYIVPESKRVDELLTELRRSKVHMAVIVDEYGGTAGLATIEDILEEIVGEIQDEYDLEEPLYVLQEGGETVEADGRLSLEDVGDLLDVNFENDHDVGTIGGFVLKHLGRLPRAGDELVTDQLKIDVLAVDHHRAKRLRITRLPAELTTASDESAPRRENGRTDE